MKYHQAILRFVRRTAAQSFVSVIVLVSAFGCSEAPKQTAQTTAETPSQTQAAPSSGQNGVAQASANNDAPSNTLRIYDATVLIAPKQQFPDKFCGKFPVHDLVRTLYTAHLKPDATSTVTVSEMLVEPLDTAQHTYIAVVKASNEQGNTSLDIFTFREGNAQPVIAHYSYTPDFDDISLKAAYNRKFRISDTEFALAFEWNAKEADDRQTQQTTMLSLFRLRNDQMQPLFELCTSSKIGNNAVGTEEYETLTEDTSSLETMNTWGKELYSILVTRTVSRKSTMETGNRGTETKRTKTLYQWDGERYVETNQLL